MCVCVCVCVCVLERDRWDFPLTAWTEAKSGSVSVKVVSVTPMSATLAPAGSVSCQCVMSPNEGELPVPLCTDLSPLMSFWINQCWCPPPISRGTSSIPFESACPPFAYPHWYPSPGCVTLAHNEPSRPPYIPFQHALSPNCECLFVGQPDFPHVWRLWYPRSLYVWLSLLLLPGAVWKTEWYSQALCSFSPSHHPYWFESDK